MLSHVDLPLCTRTSPTQCTLIDFEVRTVDLLPLLSHSKYGFYAHLISLVEIQLTPSCSIVDQLTSNPGSVSKVSQSQPLPSAAAATMGLPVMLVFPVIF